jgi:hypothetical protein
MACPEDLGVNNWSIYADVYSPPSGITVTGGSIAPLLFIRGVGWVPSPGTSKLLLPPTPLLFPFAANSQFRLEATQAPLTTVPSTGQSCSATLVGHFTD